MVEWTDHLFSSLKFIRVLLHRKKNFYSSKCLLYAHDEYLLYSDKVMGGFRRASKMFELNATENTVECWCIQFSSIA